MPAAEACGPGGGRAAAGRRRRPRGRGSGGCCGAGAGRALPADGPRGAVGGANGAARGSEEGPWAALLVLSLQAREYCPGVKNQPYVCETGHCCGETGCCTYYYELWWFWLLWTILILFSCCCAYRHRRAKLRLQQQQRQREINLIAYHGACGVAGWVAGPLRLPAYEEVAHRPSTPPPPYSAILAQLGGPHSRLGSSPLTLSPSSENFTSCSCESSCLTSPSSTSLSVQITDETERSQVSTPSEEGGSSSTGTGASWELPEEPAPCETPPKQTLFSSNVDFFEADYHRCSDIEEEEEGTGEEEGAAQGDSSEHFRHRRLTGDSGIEVGRCQEEEGGEDSEEETHLLSKAGPESPQLSEHKSLCGLQSDGGSEEPGSPVLPV
uniref:WW domain binding protein 1 n=1 Tax=Chelonoidis abingdonii TaxID=106734 RepID=A0A8C0J2A1_CHEAB